jgi:UrcA family protein
VSKFIANIASVATVALAALPMAALATAASAAPVRVQVGDLDLSSKTGQAAFTARVEAASRTLCGADRDLGRQAACRVAVRQEANEKLGVYQASRTFGLASTAR